MIQIPDLNVAGIDTLNAQGSGGLEAEIARLSRMCGASRWKRTVPSGCLLSGKITEAQLDIQRKYITERLECARAKLDD